MTQDIEKLTEGQRTIYDVLRSHPNGAREAAMIALSTPGENPLESTRKAQLACVEVVRRRYSGNVSRFLEDYATGKIKRSDIILELGREELGLGPLAPESKVYG